MTKTARDALNSWGVGEDEDADNLIAHLDAEGFIIVPKDEIARLQEAVALYSEGSIRLTAENEKLKKDLAEALVLLGTEMAK